MPIGHSDVRDIGSRDIVATWSFFLVTRANPVLFDLDVYQSIVDIKWQCSTVLIGLLFLSADSSQKGHYDYFCIHHT